MNEIIDLTESPPPDVIEISDDQGNTPSSRHSPEVVNKSKKRRRKKGRTPNSTLATSDGLTQSSATHSLQTGDENNKADKSIPCSNPAPEYITDEPGLFFVDGSAAPIVVENGSPGPQPVEFNGDGNKLLLPSHVVVFSDNGIEVPSDIIPPPKLNSDDEEYIEYLDYEDRKAPGLVRYFETEGEDSKASIIKCKKCGAEGDHKTFECPIQICLTCGARDEHSTRSCPISKTCYSCGMKGHINKTCPQRFAAHTTLSDSHTYCGRCGAKEHKMNECPTLWRIYQYVNDEERIMIMQSREGKKGLAVGAGGEGYIGEDDWCYNCANVGHLGDDCDELPHPASFPVEHSAFSSYNVFSGPFFDPTAVLMSARRRSRERKGAVDRPHFLHDWDPDVPVDVGRRGKNKDKERLEKRFREQEDEDEDWFNDKRNMKRRGMDQRKRSPGSHGKAIKFGFKDNGRERSSPPRSLPASGSGRSLLARLGDSPEGHNRGKKRDRRDPSPDNSLRIRGAAADARYQEGKSANLRRTDAARGQDRRDGDEPGSRRGHGPRYRGGYDR